MAHPKTQRNREFQEAWQRGASNKALGERFDLSLGGVKALKQRLREKDRSLHRQTPASKPVTQQTSKVAQYKKATFYIEPAVIKAIKRRALEEDKDISQLVREILKKYLNER